LNKSEFRDIQELHKNILKLHQSLRKKTQTKWKRILPFDELLFDRWEKAEYLKSKSQTSIYHNSYIFGNVKIGKNTWVGPYTLLDGSGGKLRIGNYCSISSGVQIYTHDTIKWSLSGGKASYEKMPVSISDCCYIGPYSIITKGSRIGKCSVIGAHSLVKSRIPSYSIAFGIPAKVVGKVKISGKKVLINYF